MARRKSKIRTPKMLDERYLGSLPEFTYPLVENDRRLHRTYNWYNYFHVMDDARGWVIQYMKKNGYQKEEISKFIKVGKYFTSMSAGAIAHMHNREIYIPKKHLDHLHLRIKETMEHEEEVVVTVPEKNGLSKEEKEKNLINDIIGDIDEQIDIFCNNGYVNINKFSLFKYCTARSIHPKFLTIIAHYYSKLQVELQTLVGNKSMELIEAYSGLSNKQKKDYFNFIKSIIDDANQHAQNQKVLKVRKPRAKKVKSADQIVSKMKYMQSLPELNIVGNKPVSILGAKSLWVYHPDSRNFFEYHSIDDKGFGVHGNKITNFDEKKSLRKKLRKPELIVKDVTTCGKIQLRSVFTSIKSTAYAVNGKITDAHIILRISK